MSLKTKLSRLSSAGPGGRTPKSAPQARPDQTPGPGIEKASLEAGPASPPAEASADRKERLRGLLGGMFSDERKRLQDKPKAVSVQTKLPGEYRQTDHGPLHRIEARFAPDHLHGHTPLSPARKVAPARLAELSLDSELLGFDPAKALYLDTETTGLSGGAGTIPFLIGIGYFEGEDFLVEQLLLHQPGEEAPMLRYLSERMQASSGLITYNGKSFDWPLLRSRFVLNRVPVRSPAMHLDLLHCARRIFKRRLGRVRLVNLEESVLGLTREDDVDGALIPPIFWEFVRTGDGTAISGVLEHNVNDILALAAILGVLAERFAGSSAEHEGADILGVAEVLSRFDRFGDCEKANEGAAAERKGRAAALALTAADMSEKPEVAADAHWLRAELARRAKHHELRLTCLLEGLSVAAAGRGRERFHFALAKLYEHQLKRIDDAQHHAALTGIFETEEERGHRLARLVRKAGAAQE